MKNDLQNYFTINILPVTLNTTWNFVVFRRTFLDAHERVGKERRRPLILTMSLQLCYVLIFSLIFLTKLILSQTIGYIFYHLSLYVPGRWLTLDLKIHVIFCDELTIEVIFFFFLRCNWGYNTFFQKRVSECSISFYLLWKARLKSGGNNSFPSTEL